MFAAALGYAKNGYLVFPIREEGEKYEDGRIASGKEPATKNGFLDASSDPTQIMAWWTAKPNRNIGLVTSPQSGIWVLDCDIDAETGEFGTETLAELQEKNGDLPPHPWATTPGGGQHHFFAWPDDGDIPRRIRFAPGMDALGSRGGKGGYLLAPPSRRAGASYAWQIAPEIIKPPQAPQWLVDMIRADIRGRPIDLDKIKPIRSDKTSAYGRAALRELCEEIRTAPFGQQEVTLRDKAVRVGSLAYGGNIELTEAFSSVMSAAVAMPSQPGKSTWTEQEIERKVRRHFAYAMSDPTPVPESRPSKPIYAPPPREQDDPVNTSPEHVSEIEEIEHVAAPDDKPKPAATPRRRNEPWRYLGYSHEGYHYLPDGSGLVIVLKPTEHTPLNLMQLAPLDFWCSSTGVEKMTKEGWQTIADGLMRSSIEQGMFDPKMVRGRGAWIDGKSVIVHTGSEAIVDGAPTALDAIRSRHVYERGFAWQFGFGDPCSTADAHRLVEICDRLTWADPLSAALLAGWCVIAPVSGALTWRPHIWITGGASSGKSTVQKYIVEAIVGPAAERYDGKVTEAGIRQTMGSDARPIILDEAEGEDARGADRMQGILDLARVASSGGETVKGGQNHKATRFIIRSCFCFSSINTSVRHYADESRVSKLVLIQNRAPDADAHFVALMEDINRWITPEFASAMFARTVKHLPTLLANIATFEKAATIELRSRRAADQLGPMLAGYYLCHAADAISVEKAREFIARHDWTEYVAVAATSDEMRLFEYLMTRTIKVQTSVGSQEMSVGQAIEEARASDMKRNPYQQALGARGIKVDADMIGISDTADVVRALFRDAPQWSADWKRPLRNLPAAVASKGSERFGPGIHTRATWVPISLLDGTVMREPGED